MVGCCCLFRRSVIERAGRLRVLLSFASVALAPLTGQTILAPSSGSAGPRLFNTDMAVLEAGDPRKDLPCTVVPVKPMLGFDLRFHAGYDVSIPLKDLAGTDNLLTILFRVTPENRKDEPVYFTQKVRVPAIAENATGDAYLQGMFDIGEGNYHVAWLMRDRAERVCSGYWDSEAALTSRDKQMSLGLNPGIIAAAEGEQFKEEPPIERITTEPPLNVKVLINFAPQRPDSATLRPLDTTALVSILRHIAREPHITRFSLVAFNMQEQRVLYRQESATRIDFPALGEALNTLNLGTVDLKRLGQKNGDTEFLGELIRTELGAGPERPDALVFAGPKVLLDANVPQDSLKEVGEVEYPVFYMNYNLNPQTTPWRDSIGRAVRFFRGTEYTISRPRDVWFAVTEMVSRIVKSKHGRQISAISSQ